MEVWWRGRPCGERLAQKGEIATGELFKKAALGSENPRPQTSVHFVTEGEIRRIFAEDALGRLTDLLQRVLFLRLVLKLDASTRQKHQGDENAQADVLRVALNKAHMSLLFIDVTV